LSRLASLSIGAMLGAALGGTDANLAVDDTIKKAVLEDKLRAVKVVVDSGGERLVADKSLPESESLEEDFKTIASVLEDSVPCLVLVRLKGGDGEGSAPGAEESDYAMIAWTPSLAPVKLRMLCASSRKTLQAEFKDLRFKEYNASEPDEVTLSEYMETTRELTQSDRHAAMTREELDAEAVKMLSAKEQGTQPKMLAGLAALQVQVQASFEDAFGRLLAEEGKVVLARLSGSSGEELSGEVMEETASLPSQLRGRLPEEEPCYVLIRPNEASCLMISWLPEFSAVKKKMKCSTFKASVVDTIRQRLGDRKLLQAEVSCNDDLEDNLADPPAEQPEGDAAAAQAEPAPTGPKPPPGAFALPGMGMKPPPGAVAMPGMGEILKKRKESTEAPKAESAAVETPAAAAPPAPTPETAAPAEAVEREVLTLAQLQDKSVWQAKGVNAAERELHLSDEEFQTVFKTGKDAFSKLPKWKREKLKRDVNLF